MRPTLFLLLLLLPCFAANPLSGQEIHWEIRQLTVDANEGIDLADFNGDGQTSMWWPVVTGTPRLSSRRGPSVK